MNYPPESIIIVKPTIYDFPEDFQPPAVTHGIYANTCRRCKATIRGHKYRRTCRVCVEILKREAEQQRNT